MSTVMTIDSMEALINYCALHKKCIADAMIDLEVKNSQKHREDIFNKMKKRLKKMQGAIEAGMSDGSSSPSGISGGDALKMGDYINSGAALTGDFISRAMHYAMATSECNARMGVIVATPTAGSAGVLPGILFSLRDREGYSDDVLTKGLFTASMLGYIIANRSFISGSAGGCQAEVGSATAMAAGTIVELRGGTPRQAVNAVGMAMKSMLGLVCDPVAGLVEVPCIKRNVIGTAIAFTAADMALAGIESRIPCDEIIEAMYKIGSEMPRTLRETALGGLAATPTGKKLKETLFS